MNKLMPLSRVVVIAAVAALVIGIVFVALGVTKANWITSQMAQEKVPVSIFGGNTTAYVDSAATAQLAADTIKEHRQNIAPTYRDLTKYGRSGYDPTNTDPYPPNPKLTIGEAMLDYTQALNMENYLYMAVFALNFTQMVIVSGVFMILVGIALGAIWMALRRKAALATT